MSKQNFLLKCLTFCVIFGVLLAFITSCNQQSSILVDNNTNPISGDVDDIDAPWRDSINQTLPDSFRAYIPYSMRKWYDLDSTSNGEIMVDANKSYAEWDDFTPENAPEDAPNILFILYDDTGLGAWSPYGGGIDMPTLDGLAEDGLIYTQWHTTALCSPTRSTIMTGRNHHLNGMASITETADGYPGANGRIPPDCVPFAEVLQDNGYSTFWLGKNHNVPETDVAPGGYRGEWPLQQGFDRYYGFLGGETNNWYPDMVEDNRFVEAPSKPNKCPDGYGNSNCHPEEGYHLSKDLADKALEMLRNQQASNPSKPWYMWYCPGANHAPHHSPPVNTKAYMDKGTFKQGYEAYRTQIHKRMIELGILPEGTKLTRQNFLDEDVANPLDYVTPWEELDQDEKDLYIRMAEVYAGFSTYTDSQVGRVIDYLKETGQYENTIILYAADNGASGEGSPGGSVNENKFFNGWPDEPEDNAKFYDKLGTEDTYNHFPTGWASAFSTPFKMFKRYSQFAGGTNDPLVITWPKMTKDLGSKANRIRHQFHHSVDIVPTLLEAIGIEMPKVHNGVEQKDLSGVSMLYTINGNIAPDDPTQKKIQYFSMLGTRGIWKDGWKAIELHAPTSGKAGYSDEGWELYRIEPLNEELTGDRSESVNLAGDPKYAGILDDLIDAWYKEAAINNVLPLDDRAAEQLLTVERPSPEDNTNKKIFRYYPNTAAVPEGVAVNVRGRSYTITATVEDLKNNAGGVLFAHGSRFGGHTLYIKEGELVYHYNFLGVENESRTIRGNLGTDISSIASLKAEFTIDKNYDNPNLKDGNPKSRHGEHRGMLRLYINDNQEPIASDSIFTQAAKFTLSGDGLCVGYDSADAITLDYPNLEEGGKFTGGTLKYVEVKVEGEPSKNLKAEALRIMSRH